MVEFADEEADRAPAVAEGQRAGRAGVDSELVLDSDAAHVIAAPRPAGGVGEELRYEEAADALRPRRRFGGPGQAQVHDVVGQVIVAVGDEYLRAADTPRPVGLRDGRRADLAQVRAGVGLAEAHRPGPFAA